jgi:hypothetical protein
MVVNVPSLSASARSSGRVEKRWQSFLNYQPSTTNLAAAQGPALAQTPVLLVAFSPTLVWTREFDGQDSGRTTMFRVVILAAAAVLVAIAVPPVRADDRSVCVNQRASPMSAYTNVCSGSAIRSLIPSHCKLLSSKDTMGWRRDSLSIVASINGVIDGSFICRNPTTTAKSAALPLCWIALS